MIRKTLVGLVALGAAGAGTVLGTSSLQQRPARAEPAVTIGRAHPQKTSAVNLPSVDSGPIFILALGSDARPGQEIDRQRADSIHVIGINPRKNRASILGFPRDSWVSIPGHGTEKINAGMTLGGPPLMVQTIESLTGIKLDYYALTSFGGLKHMVNTVGGIPVKVPYPMDDSYSGAHFSAGPQRLDGRDALAFSRDRHDVPNGDFSRSENQGRVMMAALAEFRRQFARDAGSVLTWLAAGMRNVRTDLTIPELLRLGFAAAAIPATSVNNVVVPGRAGSAGDASVVFVSSSAGSIFADMRTDGLIGRG